MHVISFLRNLYHCYFFDDVFFKQYRDNNGELLPSGSFADAYQSDPW